ncbi:MAG: hypothetical protein GY926_09850 [bacterium]|nr:hypothetical protein [bacterium]MCP4965527.1 hypothetical protein [bacterium]
MARTAPDDPIHDLEPGETSVVVLEGVVSGFTRWSGLGGIVGILVALTVPRLLNMGFVTGAIAIVVVLTGVFALVYFAAGRPLARRSTPPMQSPYLTVHLTNRRVMLFDRPLGTDVPALVESTDSNDVSTVRYGAAGMLVPQRLGFVIRGTERREYEFARSQSVQEFVDHFGEAPDPTA